MPNTPKATPTLEVPLDLEPEHLQELSQIFGLASDQLDQHLALVAAAALREYVLAFTGRRTPASTRELRELRLQLLYRYLPGDEPSDDQIAQLFQLTPSQVGMLIAGARARFSAEIDPRLRQAALDALGQAQKVDDNTIRIIIADSLARYLRDLISRTSAPPLIRRKDASRTYDLGRTTIAALCRQLVVEPSDAVVQLAWND
jgi:hypothetical protein